MLISFRFSIIGLHLLVLTHIAHTFVLLTANVEDVKKLARKFVSDSLAEKIADFIAKATQNMGTNISEENDMNQENSHHVSEENNMYNVERHGFESAAQDNVKSAENVKEEATLENQDQEDTLHDQSLSIEQTEKPYDVPEKDKPSENAVNEFPVALDGPSRYVKVEPNLAKQYAYPLQMPEKKPPKLSEEDEKYNENKPSRYLDDNFVSSTSEPSSLNAEKYIPEVKPTKKKIRGRPYRLLSHLNSIEDNEVTEAAPDSNYNATVDEFSENELFNQKRSMGNVLTTRKEDTKVEFDQYDNQNYQHATHGKLIATSGPVALERPDEDENWWEKELPNDGENKRKSWF